jgi:hypothetical protein
MAPAETMMVWLQRRVRVVSPVARTLHSLRLTRAASYRRILSFRAAVASRSGRWFGSRIMYDRHLCNNYDDATVLVIYDR